MYNRPMRTLLLVPALLVAACASSSEEATSSATGDAGEISLAYPLDEPDRAAQFFHFTDEEAFGWSADHGGGLALLGSASYSPPHRSPHAIALLDIPEVRSFELEADLLQSGREYGHRDLCLFFGFQGPGRFYYVHMATTPDQNAHNVFLVDGAPRRNLIEPRERGVDWGTGIWHHVKLARDVDAGTIRVWFDDMETPILEAVDTTLDWGRVGFGSFDDEGMLRNLVIRTDALRATTYEENPFAR